MSTNRSEITADQRKSARRLETATVRLAGDSGDGMQLVGGQLTNTSALAGNDVATLPDFPAEIRAPKGTLAAARNYSTALTPSPRRATSSTS
jgi:2-oxoglutarate ferredoxin oxidoreductase subunit alpha